MPRQRPQTVISRDEYRGLTTERQFLQDVTDLARLLGWRAFHAWLAIKSDAGYPDLTLVRARPGEPPRIIFAELKRDGAEPTDRQRGWLLDLATVAEYLSVSFGEPVVSTHVWRTADWHAGEVERVLRGLGPGEEG